MYLDLDQIGSSCSRTTIRMGLLESLESHKFLMIARNSSKYLESPPGARPASQGHILELSRFAEVDRFYPRQVYGEQRFGQ